jgi:hypothetical protein
MAARCKTTEKEKSRAERKINGRATNEPTVPEATGTYPLYAPVARKMMRVRMGE